jgi:hypothetical protein
MVFGMDDEKTKKLYNIIEELTMHIVETNDILIQTIRRVDELEVELAEHKSLGAVCPHTLR